MPGFDRSMSEFRSARKQMGGGGWGLGGGGWVKIEKFFMRLKVPWESFTQVFSLMISQS